jgi:hypothetical protein
VEDTIDYAINTAKQHMTIIQPAVVKPEHWCPYIIVQRRDGGHSVYRADAWTPATGSMLPWSKPEGTPVARVELNLSVVML